MNQCLINTMIDLRKSANSKKIPKNENPNKIMNTVKNFNKQQKGRGSTSDLTRHLKILTPKEMLQRLPIALAEEKAGNTSESLLNEIRKRIFSLY